MKARFISLTLKTLLLSVAIFPHVADAQSIIQRSTSPYLPDIKFSVTAPTHPIASLPAEQNSSLNKVTPCCTFEVMASDRTIREVLQRWAHASGWQHEPVHWTLMRDFPMQGTASAEYFGGDFREATRKLLASTATTDLPAQPCFYTNFIVRVVPQAEQCNRTATAAQQ